MSYIDHVASVAVNLSVNDLDNVEMRLLSLWNAYEDAARSVGYDIFIDMQNTRQQIRELGQRLIRTLYRIPGANPKTDAEQLVAKDREYGGSWLKRGGVGAFMMATRKYDRILTMILRPIADSQRGSLRFCIEHDQREEGILDDLGDLRRYLILFEAHYISMDIEVVHPTHGPDDQPF